MPLLTQCNCTRYTLHISHDGDPENPREVFDRLGTFYYSNQSRYTLGDARTSWPEMREIEKDKSLFVVPYYAHVHSDTTLSLYPFSCPWDSGQAGIATINKAKFCQEFGYKRWNRYAKEKAMATLGAE